MPFDFGLVEDHKLLIELDGRQHFQQISNWDSPEDVQLKDVEKIHKAIAEGYSIIHIYQDEVWNDKYDWKVLLKKQIDLMLLDPKPQVVFISKIDVYGLHIEKLIADITYQVIHPEVKE